MEIDPAELTHAPMTLRILALGLGVAIGLLIIAVRLRARRFLVLSVACGVCACEILLFLSYGINRDGLSWQWSTPGFLTNAASDTAVVVTLLALVIGAGVCLVRQWRNSYGRSVA